MAKNQPLPAPAPASAVVSNRFDALRQQGAITIIGTGISASVRLPVYATAAVVIVAEEASITAGRAIDASLRAANAGVIAFDAAVRASEKALEISGKTDAASYEADVTKLADRIYNACKSSK